MKLPEDEITISALNFWAQTYQQVAAFWRYLREQSSNVGGTQLTAFNVECQSDATGPTISAWAEGGIGNGEAITWWLDINYRENGWLLSASVSWNGNDTIIKLPEQVVADFRAVQKVVPLLLEELFKVGLPTFELAIERSKKNKLEVEDSP